jgi:hypothetical protein
LKSSPPPYLSLAPNGSSPLLAQTALTTGVSYASADAGVLDSTVRPSSYRSYTYI